MELLNTKHDNMGPTGPQMKPAKVQTAFLRDIKNISRNGRIWSVKSKK